MNAECIFYHAHCYLHFQASPVFVISNSGNWQTLHTEFLTATEKHSEALEWNCDVCIPVHV